MEFGKINKVSNVMVLFVFAMVFDLRLDKFFVVYLFCANAIFDNIIKTKNGIFILQHTCNKDKNYSIDSCIRTNKQN